MPGLAEILRDVEVIGGAHALQSAARKLCAIVPGSNMVHHGTSSCSCRYASDAALELLGTVFQVRSHALLHVLQGQSRLCHLHLAAAARDNFDLHRLARMETVLQALSELSHYRVTGSILQDVVAWSSRAVGFELPAGGCGANCGAERRRAVRDGGPRRQGGAEGCHTGWRGAAAGAPAARPHRTATG